MTQEEKAKRYDEALKEAKDCHIDGLALSQPVKDVLEHIFPELKESEDEKIRKMLIRHIAQERGSLSNDEAAEAIAWLERQGEQKPLEEGTFVNVDEVREDFIQEVYRVLDADPTNDRANLIIDAFDSLPTLEFEKQDEKTTLNMSTNNDNDIDICNTCEERRNCSKSNYVKSHCWRRG